MSRSHIVCPSQGGMATKIQAAKIATAAGVRQAHFMCIVCMSACVCVGVCACACVYVWVCACVFLFPSVPNHAVQCAAVEFSSYSYTQ